MRLWIFGLLVLGMACQPIDEASSHRYLPPGNDMGDSDELGDEPKWNAGQSVLPMDLDGPVVGPVQGDDRERILYDYLGWPGDLEGLPPFSTDSDGISFSGNNRLTWCLRKSSQHDGDDAGDEPDLSIAGTKLAIQAAANEWMWNAKFQLREVGCNVFYADCTADIEVEFLNSGDPLYEEILYIEATDAYANAVAAPPTGFYSGERGACTKIFVNDEKDWTLSYRDPEDVDEEGYLFGPPGDIQSTILHEMGHALGLCHVFEYEFDSSGSVIGTGTPSYCTESTDLDLDLCETWAGPRAVMCPYYDGSTRTLHADDVASIQDMYGASEGVCSDGYSLAYTAKYLTQAASDRANLLVDTYPGEASFEDAADYLETALFYATKLEGAAETARDTEPGMGLVATRHLYDAETAAQLGRDAYVDGDSLATDIIAAIAEIWAVQALADEVLDVLPVVYLLEDQCYTDEYGEHEDGS